jgi:hypothetical protein
MASRGHFYARLEDQEWNLLEALPDQAPFDGAIVKAAYLAPYPEGGRRHGRNPFHLRDVLNRRGWKWALDPGTAPHGHHRANDWSSSRARQCTLAQALPLPWEASKIADPEVAQFLTDRAAVLQETSAAIAPAYFESAGANHVAVDANCELIRRISERAMDQRVVAYLQTLPSHLRSGDVARIAERYIAAGAQTILVRVRGLDPLRLEDVVAYLALIEQIDHGGARAVADSVGFLGPVLVAGGADAFSAGARCFQKVADALLSDNSKQRGDGDDSSGGGPELQYAEPGRLIGSRRRGLAGQAFPCPHPGCRAEGGRGENRFVREHNFHEFKELSVTAAAAGFAYVDHLRALGTPQALLWAKALDSRAAQRRAQ